MRTNKAPAKQSKRQNLHNVHKMIITLLFQRKHEDSFIMERVKRTFKNAKLNWNLSQYRWHLNNGQCVAGLALPKGKKLVRIEAKETK